MAKKSPAPKATKQPKMRKRATSTGLTIAGVPTVNLLPPSEVAQRTAVALIKRWLAALVATAIAVSALVVGAHQIHAAAAQQLASEQARTLALNSDLAGLSHVSERITERADLTRMRADAMGNDTAWRSLFKYVRDATPNGAEIMAFDLIPGANPVPGQTPELGIGMIGRFTLSTDDPTHHHRMIDSLRRLDITLAADAGALTANPEGDFTFVVEVVFDQALYSGDHLSEDGER